MGFFRFRRSIKIIPGVRLNLSGSGPSVSLGVKGLHYTIGSKGTRTTIGIPGTGLSWTEHRRYGSPPTSGDAGKSASRAADATTPSQADTVAISNPNAEVFESSPIDQLVTNSTADIAHILSANKARWPKYKALITVLAFLFGGGIIASAIVAGDASQPLTIALAIVAVLIWPTVAVCLYRACITSIEYDLSESEMARFNRLSSGFDLVTRSERVWQIPTETAETDWKRNAGASSTVARKLITLGVTSGSWSYSRCRSRDGWPINCNCLWWAVIGGAHLPAGISQNLRWR
jgi:hypothetical protein